MISLTATMVSIALLWQGRNLHCRRLYVAAVLTFYVGGWAYGLESLVWPEPKLWLNLLAATALLSMGWWWRLGSAPLAAAVCFLPGLSALLPQTAFQWGSTMLGWGFIALLSGLIANLYTTDLRPANRAGTGQAIDG